MTLSLNVLNDHCFQLLAHTSSFSKRDRRPHPQCWMLTRVEESLLNLSSSTSSDVGASNQWQGSTRTVKARITSSTSQHKHQLNLICSISCSNWGLTSFEQMILILIVIMIKLKKLAKIVEPFFNEASNKRFSTLLDKNIMLGNYASKQEI